MDDMDVELVAELLRALKIAKVLVDELTSDMSKETAEYYYQNYVEILNAINKAEKTI